MKPSERIEQIAQELDNRKNAKAIMRYSWIEERTYREAITQFLDEFIDEKEERTSRNIEIAEKFCSILEMKTGKKCHY